MKGDATSRNKLSFGDFGLQTLETAWVSARQIEAARRAITHYTQEVDASGSEFFRINQLVKKPPEVRMGGGKGDTHEYVAPVRPGRIMFEISGVTHEVAKKRCVWQLTNCLLKQELL